MSDEPGGQSLPQLVAEVVPMIVAYLKEQTIGPFRGLGRYVVFGVAGSVALSIGLVLLLLASVRVLQEDTGSVLAGSLSWVPYLAAVVLCMVIAGASLKAALSGRKKAAGKR